MSTSLICALLLTAAQAPASSSAAAQAKRDSMHRDTVPAAVQPPPTIIVEAQSQWPVIVIGVATLLLFAVQVRIMARQTDILNRQTAIAAQQAEWRQTEALGAFYRLGHDLATEFKKADVLPLTPIKADFNTHPRYMLREASRLFAPLGSAFVSAANQAARHLDAYFLAVEAYNGDYKSREGANLLEAVQALREQVGDVLNLAKDTLDKRTRWIYADGSEDDFRALCSPPPGFLEALAIETSTPPGGAGAEDS